VERVDVGSGLITRYSEKAAELAFRGGKRLLGARPNNRRFSNGIALKPPHKSRGRQAHVGGVSSVTISCESQQDRSFGLSRG